MKEYTYEMTDGQRKDYASFFANTEQEAEEQAKDYCYTYEMTYEFIRVEE